MNYKDLMDALDIIQKHGSKIWNEQGNCPAWRFMNRAADHLAPRADAALREAIGRDD